MPKSRKPRLRLVANNPLPGKRKIEKAKTLREKQAEWMDAFVKSVGEEAEVALTEANTKAIAAWIIERKLTAVQAVILLVNAAASVACDVKMEDGKGLPISLKQRVQWYANIANLIAGQRFEVQSKKLNGQPPFDKEPA